MSYDGGHSNKTASDPGGHNELKKWHIANDYSHKWSLYWVITWKSLFSGGIKIWLGESTGRFWLKRGLPPGDSLLPPFRPVGKILRNIGNHKMNAELLEENLAMQTISHNFQIHLVSSF